MHGFAGAQCFYGTTSIKLPAVVDAVLALTCCCSPCTCVRGTIPVVSVTLQEYIHERNVENASCCIEAAVQYNIVGWRVEWERGCGMGWKRAGCTPRYIDK